jgi:SAM-dependent methyltransferase
MARTDFSRRAATPELMDIEEVSYADFRACLRDLAKVNRLTLAYRPTLGFLGSVVAAGRLPVGRPLSILDAGCGFGDALRRIDHWAQRRGVPVRLTGVDLSAHAMRAAAEATPPGRPIRWVKADLLSWRAEDGIDLIVSSLFAHHLDDRALIGFIRWMEATARIGWFVNDLHRHPLPYHVFRLWAGAARWHRFVRHDGPVSITRAFSRADWRRLLGEAGFAQDSAAVRWRVPFRLCVSRLRAPAGSMPGSAPVSGPLS